MGKPLTITVDSDEAEELLSGLKLRMGQKRWTNKELTNRVARKIEAAATPAFGWTPGIWERCQYPAIVVTVKAL